MGLNLVIPQFEPHNGPWTVNLCDVLAARAWHAELRCPARNKIAENKCLPQIRDLLHNILVYDFP